MIKSHTNFQKIFYSSLGSYLSNFHFFKLAFLHSALSGAECDIFLRGKNENASKLWNLEWCLKVPPLPRFIWFIWILVGKYQNIIILDYKKNAFCWHWVLTGEVNYELRAQKLKDKEKWQFKHLTGSVHFLESVLREVAKWNHKSAGGREATGQQNTQEVMCSLCPPVTYTLAFTHVPLFSPRAEWGDWKQWSPGFSFCSKDTHILGISEFCAARIDYF